MAQLSVLSFDTIRFNGRKQMLYMHRDTFVDVEKAI